MPIYEYSCTKCGNVFEFKRSFSESTAEAPACPGCGGACEKLMSVFASTAGFGVKVPEKEAFRKSAPKKTVKRAKK